MYILKITYELKLPDDIAESPAELIEMFNNKEFVLHKEDITEVSATQMDGFKYMHKIARDFRTKERNAKTTTSKEV